MIGHDLLNAILMIWGIDDRSKELKSVTAAGKERPEVWEKAIRFIDHVDVVLGNGTFGKIFRDKTD